MRALTLAPRRPGNSVAACTLLAIVFLALAADAAQAQSVQHTENKADLSLKSDLRVDPSTLGMSISIPLASYPGRAGAGLPVAVTYSSKSLRLDYRFTDSSQLSGLKVWTGAEFAEHSTAGWTSTLGSPRVEFTGRGQYYDYEGRGASELCVTEQCPVGNYYVERIHVHMPDGSAHELRADDLPRTTPLEPFTGTFLAVDGTRMRFESNANSASVLYLPDGSRYLFPAYNNGADLTATQLVDRNGNALTYNAAARQWTDTLGRVITDPLPQNPAADTATYFSAKLVGGGSATYTFRWKYLGDVLTPDPSTGQPPPLRYPGDNKCFHNNYPPVTPSLFASDTGTRVCVELDQSGNPILFNPVVLAEVELPTGNKYAFTYNVYGEIDHVQLPTGGTESLTYAQVPALSYTTLPYDQTNRGVVQRRAGAGGGAAESVWNYAVTSASPYTVRETAPDGSYGERLLFKGLNTTSSDDFVKFGFDDARAGMAYEERSFNPSGVMLRRTLSKWEEAGPTTGAPYGSRDPKVTKAVSILLDTGGGNALAKTTVYQYDADLNVTATTGYDFAQVSQATAQTGAISSIPAGTPLRTDETTFLVNDTTVDANTRAAYRAHNLLSLPSSARVRAGGASGAVVAKSEVKYDEPGFPLITYGAVTGWVDPQATVRGNPTTSRVWVDTTGGWLDTHAQYDQCGGVRTTWDANDPALANPSQVSYADSFSDGVARNTYAFPTRGTSAIPDPGNTGSGSNVGLVTTTTYDFNTGLVTSATDPNGKTAAYEYNDPLGRVTKVTRPDGGTTSYTYGRSMNAGLANDYVRTLTSLDSSRSLDSYQFFDGLGRPSRVFLNEGGSPAVLITRDTQYDALGRVYRVSNPYRTNGSGDAVNPSNRWTTTEYDTLGRLTKVTTPDGARVRTAYNGVQVLGTDQANRQRVSKTDALGRLTEVWEVKAADPQNPDPGLESVSFPAPADVPAVSTGYHTLYTYDTLGNLRKVNQGGQLRYFMYDSLSRLIRAKNPEQAAGSVVSNITDTVTGNSQWSLAYGYDGNGNLTARVDARGVTTNYAYDRLNRNTTITYTRPSVTDVATTPDVKRYYDNAAAGANGLGRPYWVHTVGVSATVFDKYDEAGRPTQYRQNFWVNNAWGQPFSVSRSYDKAGNVVSQTYPSGRTVSYGYDAAGRLSGFSGNLGDGVQRAYSTGVTYSEYGGIQQEQFGTQVPLYRKLRYNVRGQLYDTRLSSVSWAADPMDWNRGALVNCYSAAELGGVSDAQRALSGADNNGNLRRAYNYIPLDSGGTYNGTVASPYAYYQDDYDYDALNRLSYVAETSGVSSVPSATPFKQAYAYDRFGNRRIDAGQTFGVAATQFELSPATNQEVAEPSNRLYAPGDSARAPSQKLMRYDAAGNLVYDAHTGQGARVYDAENRMTQAQDVYQQWSTYTYDADGQRVKRLVANQETWQVYGMGGELLAEYGSGSAPLTSTKEYGYRGGELLVTMSSGDDQRLKRFVTNLYYGALRRDPTAQELADASNQLAAAGAQGQSQLLGTAKQVARALFTQTSYETASPARTDTQYVSDLYYTYMQRAADDPGLAWWVSQLASKGRSGVCDDFQNSVEFDVLVTTLYGSATSDNQRTEQFVTNFYLGAYGRFPTQPELQQQRDALNASAAQGQSQVQAQAETMGRALFAAQVNDFSISAQQFVTNLYEGFLQRGPDASGLAFWTAQAGTTAAARQNVLSSFATSPPSRELSGALYRETFWLVGDHLGTPRMVVDKSGSLAGIKRHDYLPFGEEVGANVGGRTAGQGYSAVDNVRQKFTDKERDGETGLDFFGARYYASAQGRFTSVDPHDINIERQSIPDAKKAEEIFAAYIRNPQQWNKYAYAINNPLKYVDPTGEEIELFGNEEEREKQFNDLLALVGPEAAQYLYVEGVKDSKGNSRYYVRIRKDAKDKFAKINPVTGELAPIITSDKVVILRIMPPDFHEVEADDGIVIKIAPAGKGGSPGVTMSYGGSLTIFLLDPTQDQGTYPARDMEGNVSGVQVRPEYVLAHELGRAGARMRGDPDDTGSALRFERKAMKLHNPKGPLRKTELPPPPKR